MYTPGLLIRWSWVRIPPLPFTADAGETLPCVAAEQGDQASRSTRRSTRSATRDPWQGILRGLVAVAAIITLAAWHAPNAAAHTVTPPTCRAVAAIYPPKHRRAVAVTCIRLAAKHTIEHAVAQARARCLAVPGSPLGYGACDALARIRRQWAASAALHELLDRESSGNPNAVNEGSGACGLFQRLPCPWDYFGGSSSPSDDRVYAEPRVQVVNGVRYIDGRYGSPAAALAAHDRQGWY